MDVVYIAGTDADFVAFVKKQKMAGKARWESIDGHARWVITDENGKEYIARPVSATK